MVSDRERPVVILGGGGHALVCLDLLKRQRRTVNGYVSPVRSERFDRRIPYLGNDAKFEGSSELIELVNGVGSMPGSVAREKIYNEFRNRGYKFASIVHDAAIVSAEAVLEEGVQVMAGAIVQAGAFVGCNALVNTRSTVDHDSMIGAHVHVASGAMLCGQVRIGDAAFIGAGSTVIQGIAIGERVVIGAGSVVVRNIGAGARAFGTPAKER